MSFVVLAACALVLGVVAGCAPSGGTTGGGTTTGAKSGGSMSFYIGEPAYIDPYNTQESEGTQVEQALFDSLTRVDPLDPSKLGPGAADSWTANADATVFTFKLNPNGKFADGTPVTAQDFVYAWTRIVDPTTVNTLTKKADPSVISYHLSFVVGFDELSAGKTKVLPGVKAIDPLTFEVTLSKPFADFPFVCAHPALAPVPQKLVENGVEASGTVVPFGEMPVGNGPFKMAEPWQHNQFIKIVRNDNYAGAKPYLDSVLFKIYKDSEAAYTDFVAGNLDFSPIGTGKIKSAQDAYGTSDDGYTVNPGKQVLLGAENATYYLICNMNDPVMKNPNVRKAISLAINRQAICDIVFEGTRQPADNIIPPGIAGYQPGVWADTKYDVTAAKQALSDAGYPGGVGSDGKPLALKLSFNSGAGHEPIMELVQSDLKAIGITATFDSSEFAVYLKQLDAGQFQIARLGWIADYPIADNFLYPLFQSKSGDNKSKFNDPAVDAALDAARKTVDTAARIAAYQAVDKTVAAANPVLPMMFYKHTRVGSKRLHNFVWDAQGLGDFGTVWVD